MDLIHLWVRQILDCVNILYACVFADLVSSSCQILQAIMGLKFESYYFVAYSAMTDAKYSQARGEV